MKKVQKQVRRVFDTDQPFCIRSCIKFRRLACLCVQRTFECKDLEILAGKCSGLPNAAKRPNKAAPPRIFARSAAVTFNLTPAKI